jgi:PadR family transcriptional regulator, regulatory protein PadR
VDDGNTPRFTFRGLKLLRIFLDDVEREQVGADLMTATGLKSGNLYPILRSFEEKGLLASHWESGDPVALGRPLRRFYKITKRGKLAARKALSELGLT